jgi:hypothetical protein
MASYGKRRRMSTGIREYDSTNLISTGKLKTIVPDYLKKNAIISKIKKDLELIADEFFRKDQEVISVDELIKRYKESVTEKLHSINASDEEHLEKRQLIMDYFNEYFNQFGF